ncbi:MAG: triose-phosphate isomerase [Spirochaetes bacterium]|nr:triose-phosphate isomerase [Spirochaetota bacterium]
MRKYLIAGNWKMNLVPSKAKEFAEELVDNLKKINDDIIVMVAPPFTALEGVSNIIKGSKIKLGAQNINDNEDGAYTGEISADMLLDIGVEYVIIGHSERRHIYNENNEFINKKVLKALSKGLKPILCVGELLSERETGDTEKVVREQVVKCLNGVSREQMVNLVIAYEPVWAIGTGKVATPEQAEEVHAFIRKLIEELYDKDTASDLIIQYGGSVKPDNIDGLMVKENLDGALVGGASLKVDSFCRLVNFNK